MSAAARPRAVAAVDGWRPRRASRTEVDGALDGPLFFAQVREDPRVELRALMHPRPARRVVVISSGGCTALSLLAAGAARVDAVDLNRAQNHLVELKAAAVRRLDRLDALRFLGALPTSAAARTASYRWIQEELTDAARDWWDARPRAIARGVLGAGRSERFIRIVAAVVRHGVVGRRGVARMLAARDLDEQRALFGREWEGTRWRALFALLLNRAVMSRAYDPAFFAHVGRRSFAEHFRTLAEHALTELPVADNYFLHLMLAGRYPVEAPHGVPPYLSERGARVLRENPGALHLVDGSITAHLASLPDRSVDAIALSNVCEWMNAAEVRALFDQASRVIAPGGRVVFRNFVGHTELASGATRLREDTALGDRLARSDRSLVQARVVVCRAVEDGSR